VVIAAAGNAGAALDSPANCDKVISVGALDEEGFKASYSNFGANLTLMAPGGENSFPMWSASNSGTSGPASNTYNPKIGTSFAAPLVAATVSMMRTLNPGLTPANILTLLKQTSRPFLSPSGSTVCAPGSRGACQCTTSTCGSGMLDAFGAINASRSNATLANLLGPTIVAPGASQQFDASQSFNPNGGALNYMWTLETHTTSQRPVLTNAGSATVSVQFPNEVGAYRLSLTVSNGNSSHTVKKDILTGVAGTANADIVASLTNLVSGAIITAVTGTEAGLDSTPGPSANNDPADPSAGGTVAGPATPSSGGGGGSIPVNAFGWMLAGLWLLRRQAKA
jgi:serine protease